MNMIRRLILSLASTGLVWLYYARNVRNTGLWGKGAAAVWRERLWPRRLSPSASRCPIWIHASGPGDVRAATHFISGIKKLAPDMPLILTVGSVPARLAAQSAIQDQSICLAWMPFDTRFSAGTCLRRWRPSLFVGMQGEFWPRVIRGLRKRRIPSAFLRVDMLDWTTQREFPDWIRPYYEEMLREITFFSVRADVYKERLIAAGVSPGRIQVGGDYRLALPLHGSGLATAQYERLLRVHDGPPWVVLASPRLDEIQAVAHALFDLITRKTLRLLIAPVSLDVCRAAGNALSSLGLHSALRSKLPDTDASPQVVLLDTHGELFRIYAVTRAAILGNTFPPALSLGANPWEPLAQGCRILHGPGMPHLDDLVDLRTQGYIAEVPSYDALPKAVAELLTEPDAREVLSVAASMVLQRGELAALEDGKQTLALLKQ